MSAGAFIAFSTAHPLKIERETVISLDESNVRAAFVHSPAAKAESASALRLFPVAPVTMGDISRRSEAAGMAARAPRVLILPRA
jgi:hypothetical protein